MRARETGIRYYRIKNSDLVFILLALFLFGFMAGIYFSPTKLVRDEVLKYRMPNLTTLTEERIIEMLVPAVDEDGNGVAASLITRVRPAVSPGYGMILVSINDVLAKYDTQLSARVAARVAEGYTNLDLTDFDVIYTIKANTSVIEGPSAGAAMAISVTAALENKTIADDVMITGTIEEDGTIGPAGAIIEKAMVAKNNNITIFLVSDKLPPHHTLQKQRNCRMINRIEYCEIEYVPKETELTEELGIIIREVKNLEEALKYFKVR